MSKRHLFGATILGLLVAAAPALAQGSYRRASSDNELRFRIGSFEPDGNSTYWEDSFFDFTGSTTSFEDVIVGIDYVHRVGPRWGILFSGSGYEATATQAYRDFEDAAGFDIRHDTTFELATGSVGLILQLLGRDAAIQPYLGFGGGFYDWSLVESGDFIDFGGDLVIFTDRFVTDGTAFGTYFLAGFAIPLGAEFSFFAEGRWDSADDALSGDFEGLGDIDLGGRQLAAGLSWQF
ncbi:MAG: hypothetical protein OES32_00575 [Acidobacteriota bacterium]|nr:hypothetical protein [Acidobacteriota bacterium]MDH3522053.1 hypothetical protein [Acidobacteriota bacterium]